MKTCFLFGHALAPNVEKEIETAAEKHYLQYDARTFVVGNRGKFDRMAATAIQSLKRRYDDISLLLLLAYHPGERRVDAGPMFDNLYYPLEKKVPRQYAITAANHYMVDHADSIICFVSDPISNSQKLLDRAERRSIPIDNLSPEER